MDADDLVTQEAKASAAKVLICLFRSIPVSSLQEVYHTATWIGDILRWQDFQINSLKRESCILIEISLMCVSNCWTDNKSALTQIIWCCTAYKLLPELKTLSLRHWGQDKMAIFQTTFWNAPTKGPIENIPALVQIMAWRRPGDKPLSEPLMIRLSTHICVTRPQWVNENLHCQAS